MLCACSFTNKESNFLRKEIFQLHPSAARHFYKSCLLHPRKHGELQILDRIKSSVKIQNYQKSETVIIVMY